MPQGTSYGSCAPSTGGSVMRLLAPIQHVEEADLAEGLLQGSDEFAAAHGRNIRRLFRDAVSGVGAEPSAVSAHERVNSMMLNGNA